MTELAAVVIGGGLAGSAFAIELARQGRPVVVFEKTTGQHHKVCGEFLSAEAQNLLARLGVDVWKWVRGLQVNWASNSAAGRRGLNYPFALLRCWPLAIFARSGGGGACCFCLSFFFCFFFFCVLEEEGK